MSNAKQVRELLDQLGVKISPQHTELIAQHCWKFFRVDPGGRTLWKVFEKEFIYKLSFDPESQRRTDFNEGTRKMFLLINAMMDEYEERNIENERSSSSDSPIEY